jgi:hypothetical protein
MTPQPQHVRAWPRDQTPEDGRAEPSLKGEAVKYLIAMLVAGLTSYFAAIYGIKEEIAVLKVRLEYMKEKIDSQTRSIDALTTSINAHTLAHQEAATPRRGARP